MGMPDTVQDVHTSHAATLLHTWVQAVRDGRVDDDEQAELSALIQRNYGLEELKRACEQLEGQIRRIPEHAPNKPLSEQVRPLVRDLDLRKAA